MALHLCSQVLAIFILCGSCALIVDPTTAVELIVHLDGIGYMKCWTSDWLTPTLPRVPQYQAHQGGVVTKHKYPRWHEEVSGCCRRSANHQILPSPFECYVRMPPVS